MREAPCCLRRVSAAVRLVRLRVRMAPGDTDVSLVGVLCVVL
jgi:hypothetical protein